MLEKNFNPPNICLIAAHESIEPGGALLIALQHGNELAKKGRLAKFLLVTSEKSAHQRLDRLGQGLTEAFLAHLEIMQVARHPKFGPLTSLFSLHLTRRLRRSLKHTNTSVMHLHKIHFAQLPILRALKGFRVFHTVHDFGILCPRTAAIKVSTSEPCQLAAGIHCSKFCQLNLGASLFYRIRQQLNFIILRSLKATLVAPSIALKNYIETAAPIATPTRHCRNPVSKQSTDSLPELVNFKLRNFRQKTLKVVFAGSLSTNKGAHLLPEIFLSINETLKVLGFHADYVIFGEGPLEQTLRTRLHLEANHLNCKMSPYIENSRLMSIFRESTIVVVPSMGQENQSGALLEAAQAGCLVVTTPFGGNPENYLDSYGCLWSQASVAEFIAKILASEDNYRDAINSAIEFAAGQSTWSKHLQQLDEIYQLS